MIDFYAFTLGGKEYKGPHEGQKKLLESKARYKVGCFGRRGGKTTCAIITLLEHAFSNSDHTYWYIAPTFRQAKTIAWKFLISRIKLLPNSYRKRVKINVTELSVELPNGSVIELKGVERPDNLLGTGLDGVVLDEYATDIYGAYPIWKEIIRPSLSDKKGWAMIISTPRGYNHFYEMFDYADTSGDPEWAAFRLPSSINPVLSETELKSAKRELGEDLYAQEYDAEFRKRSGLVYTDFDRELHVIDKFDKTLLSPKWSLELGIDFGANHPTAILYVLFNPQDDTAYVVDEYYEVGTNTDKHISAAKAIEDKWLGELRQHRPRVRWGDNQAKQTIIDWNSQGYYVTPVIKGKDSVEHGISLVAKRLRKDMVTGKPKLYITKNCPNTIREFENYAYVTADRGSAEEDELMRMAAKRKDAPRKIFDDAMDALRYVISHHVPVGTFGIKRPNSKRARNPLTGI